jgi:hypothetical protein
MDVFGVFSQSKLGKYWRASMFAQLKKSIVYSPLPGKRRHLAGIAASDFEELRGQLKRSLCVPLRFATKKHAVG